jgi:hypothetical protein
MIPSSETSTGWAWSTSSGNFSSQFARDNIRPDMIKTEPTRFNTRTWLL